MLCSTRSFFGPRRTKLDLSDSDKSICSSHLYQQIYEMFSHSENVNIYVDTCTLLSAGGLDFLKSIHHAFENTNQSLLITSAVLYELDKVGKRDLYKAKQASVVLDYIRYMEARGTVNIVYASTNFNDAALVSRFITEIQTANIILVTNDIALSETAVNLTTFLKTYGSIDPKEHTIQAFKLGQTELIRLNERKDIYEQHFLSESVSVAPRFFVAS